jgi:hypothetical protein
MLFDLSLENISLAFHGHLILNLRDEVAGNRGRFLRISCLGRGSEAFFLRYSLVRL